MALAEAERTDGRTDGRPAGDFGFGAASAAARARGEALPLEWGVFPRPYVLSSLPHRDVTMQAMHVCA